MSSYATLAEFKARLGDMYDQLTDRSGETNPSDTVGQAVLDEAEGEVNGWLSRRYAVPVPVAADATRALSLRGVTLDVAEYRAWQAFPLRKETPNRVKGAYTAAMKWLGQIATGPLLLPGASTPPPTNLAGLPSKATGTTKQWTDRAVDGIF